MASDSGITQPESDGPSRRTVLRTAAVSGVVVAGLGLAACGGDDEPSDSAGAGTNTGAAPQTSGDPSTDTGGGSAEALAETTEIEVGSGKFVGDMVIVQPADGDFKAFSTTCTHQGCKVNKVQNGVIVCPCHGSTFSVEDGSVQKGPATAPLEAVDVKVDGTSIVRG
jgi:Rieske Fe-S protein